MHKTHNHLQKLNCLEWLYAEQLLYIMKYKCHCRLMVDVVNSDQNVVFEDAENDRFENILRSRI